VIDNQCALEPVTGHNPSYVYTSSKFVCCGTQKNMSYEVQPMRNMSYEVQPMRNMQKKN